MAPGPEKTTRGFISVEVVPSGKIQRDETGAGDDALVNCVLLPSQNCGTVKSVL